MIFDSDRSQSDKFLREFRIFRLSNRNNASMNVPLDHIGIAASCIHGKNVDDWVEYMMNKIDMALAQGVLPEQEDLWDMFVRDFRLAFTDTTKKQTANKDLLNISMKPASWNAHFYLLLPTFCILRNQVTIPSLHVMARKYSHVMVCHMSDCVVLVDQACDESRG